MNTAGGAPAVFRVKKNYTEETILQSSACVRCTRPSIRDVHMVSPNITQKSIVLLTEGEESAAILVQAIQQEEFVVNVYSRHQENLDLEMFQEADLIIIESNRFSLEEISVFARIRSFYSGLLVVLSNEMDELLQVMLYEQGIDDLLFKPINPLLLLAHIRALFRRNGKRVAQPNVSFRGLEINGGTRRASYQGEEIPLSSREFDLLWYMAKNACMTLDRDKLYKNVFGYEYNGYDRAIDMYISRIRTKLSETTNLPPVIKTVRGKGYLFAVED